MVQDRRGKQKLKRFYRILAAVTAGCLLMLIPVTLRLYRQRKDTEEAIAAREYADSEEPTGFRSETVEYGGKKYRKNSSVKVILCMGVDREGDMLEKTVHTFGGQADGIFLLAQDTARNDLKVLMIPRDSMTEITLTDLNGNVLGKDIQHLTLAYAYGDGRELSCERMVEAVSGMLDGLAIDYYMSADVDVINMLNEKVGGVTVTVPSEGMEKKDPAFIKGATVTLRGEQAEAFVRYRDIEEDFSALYRMERQQEYITGFFDTVQKQSKKNPGIVEEMFGMIEDYMITDMGKEIYLKVALDALETDGLAEEDFYTVPGEAVTTDVYDEFYVDHTELTPILLELFYREVG